MAMANFSVSIINLLNGIGIGGGNTSASDAPGGTQDGFSALLNIGSPDSRDDADPRGLLSSGDQKKNSDASPSAVEVPSDVFARGKSSRRDDADNDSQNGGYEKGKGYDKNISSRDLVADDGADVAQDDKAAPVQSTAAPVQDEVAAEDTGNENISADLEKIRELLAALLQSLLGQMPVAQQTATITRTDISLTVSSDAAGTSSDAKLLQDIRNLLQQLQNTLQQLTSGTPDKNLQGKVTSFFAQFKITVGSFLQNTTQGNAPAVSANDDSGGLDKVAQLLAKIDDFIKNIAAQPADQKKLAGTDKGTDLATLLPDKAVTAAPAAVASATADTTMQAPVDAKLSAATPAFNPQMVSRSEMSNNSGNTGNGGDKPPAPVVLTLNAGNTQASSRSAGADFVNTLTQAARGSLTEQVEFHVRTALKDGSSKIHIQLDPAELGKLDIKLDVASNGKTGVVITADSKTTLELLQKDTSGLMRALTDAGLTTDSGSLSFNLRGGQQEQGPDYSQASSTYKKATPDDTEELAANIITRSYVVNLAEGLDIRI